LSYAEARRVRVHHVPEPDEEETIQYYAAEPQDEEEEPRQRVVLVSSADQYNGLYGQPTASSRSGGQDNYIPSSRKALAITRAKESAKSPPIQTIRNYNKVNDDGSFTFGYEAADGSFKEETRGTDCVVRGKYGYIDPDGNKREFTYVSGNPCDPNAPKEEQEPRTRTRKRTRKYSCQLSDSTNSTDTTSDDCTKTCSRFVPKYLRPERGRTTRTRASAEAPTGNIFA
jgi:hypothetical protein